MGLAPFRATRGNGSRRFTTLAFCIVCLLLSAELAVGANRTPKFPKAKKGKGLKALETSQKTEETSVQNLINEPASSSKNLTDESAESSLSKNATETKSTESESKIGQAETAKIFDEILSHPNLNLTLLRDIAQNNSAFSDSDPGLNSTVLVKARLRANDVLNKTGGKQKNPHAKPLVGNKHTSKDGALQRIKRSGGLDIVIAHHDIDRTEQMVDYWLAFLQMEKVQALEPYVFIYCQNEKYDLNEDDFRPILQLGGEIVHLPNVGRESHAYLEHITKRFNDLANHTLFAQDASWEGLPERFEKLFEKKTGFLPLALVGHVDCEDPWLPKGVIPQMYAMFANELCPPVGYTSSFEGQFIVSKSRIQRNGWWTYQRLLDLLAADENHWIHAKHDNAHYKDKTNPLFGHVLERTWSVAFDCFESWREGNCWQCVVAQGMQGCGEGDCQCFDKS